VRDANEEWAEQRRRIAAEVRAGRASAAEIGAALGVSRETVRRWVRGEKAESRFVRVAVHPAPSAGAALEVVLDRGVVLRVPPGFDEDEVARLVRALRAC
jgi:transposase-like protein